MLIAIILFGSMLLMGFPIYLGLLATGLYLQIFVNNIPSDMVISALFDGISKPSLLAIPMFIFAGCLMERSSIANRLVGAILPWLRKVRGGVPLTALFANEIFGAMSGSAPAAAATIGRVMLPAITKSNSEKFGLGLLTSAGALAIVMPPSINMIVFAAATDTSIGDLFLAGIVPALIIGVIIGSYIIYKSKPVTEGKFNFREAVSETVKGIPVLLLPLLVLGGIYNGIFTPTEAGVIAAVYCFLLPLLLYKDYTLQKLKESLMEALKLNAQIFILIAGSTVFSQALTVAQVPQTVAQLLTGVSPAVFFIGLNILLLIVGCFFDPVSAVLVLAPMLIKISTPLGINPIHLGIVSTVNLAIGMFTPPFGLNLFVMQSIFKKRMEEVVASVPGFFACYILALAIITAFPNLYVWVPELLK